MLPIRVFAAFVALCLASPVIAQPAELDAFVNAPDFGMPRLSPRGDKVAYTSERDGALFLVVRDLATDEVQARNITNLRPEDLRWASDRILLLSASDVADVWGLPGRVDFSGIVAFDLENDLDDRQLLRRSNRLGFNLHISEIAGIAPETGRVLLPAFDDHNRLNLFSVDPVDGGMRAVAVGASNTRQWVVDTHGEPVARLDYSNDRDRQTLRVPDGDGGAGWQEVVQVDTERPTYSIAGFLPDGRLAATTRRVPFSEDEDSRVSLYELSLETGDLVDTIFSHRRHDLSSTITDPYNNQVVGVGWEEEFRRVEWFDTELAEHQALVEAALPGAHPRIQSWNRARTRFLVLTEAPDVPPVYYLYDTGRSTIEFIAADYPAITVGVLRPRLLIRYETRDGVGVEAYLTRPEGDGPFPTVVLPHGGPAARDVGGFDDFAHFLTSRGYAVVQPNYRGSAGYGYRWQHDGDGQWGTGIMQHDVTDALDRLVASGIADPDRVCIVGASYGGYAALAGLAFTPDRYRCGISIAGVSDLDGMLSYIRERYGASHWVMTAWGAQISGDSDERQRSLMRSLSPSQHAGNIRAPVLLIHGENDTVVPIRQSRIMRRALRRADAEVELVVLDNGDHWLTNTQARRTVLEEVERFLAEHIGE